MSNIIFEISDSIGILTLSRQDKLNAITPDMLTTICDAVDEAETNPQLRAIILRGEGKVFSVGADINIWSALTPEEFRLSWITLGHRACDRITNCRLPVIAAIHGLAFGGGLELALAADLRVAERSTQLALPETSLGTVPGWGGTQRLPEIIGRSRAKQMVLASRRVDAPKAETWGLIDTLCDDGMSMDAAGILAAEISKCAPIAVQLAKRAIDGRTGNGLSQTLEMLTGMATQNTSDLQEGLAAYREKRSAQFEGD